MAALKVQTVFIRALSRKITLLVLAMTLIGTNLSMGTAFAAGQEFSGMLLSEKYNRPQLPFDVGSTEDSNIVYSEENENINQVTSLPLKSTTTNYLVHYITPSTTGKYTIEVVRTELNPGSSCSEPDTMLFLYRGGFDSVDPKTNLIAANDDTGASVNGCLSHLPNITLTGAQPYTLVVTSFDPNDEGEVTFNVSGAGTVTESETPPALSSTKAVTAFNFTSPAATGTVNEGAKTIAVTVPFGTDVTSLTPSITHTGASVSPSGAQDFTSPVTYTVTAADNSTQTYTVTVTVGANPAKAITAFGFTSPSAVGTVNEGAKTIAVTVPFGTDVTSLTPSITHTGASVSPSGAQDFTNPVTYTVTAADSSTQTYTVTVTIQSRPPEVPVSNPHLNTNDDDGVAVIVNGVKQDKTASAKVTTVDNKKVTTITVDEQKLNEKLQTVDPGYKVTIPVNNQSDVIVGELNAQMVKNMESKQAVLEVQTEKASYTLPAIQVNVDAISRKVGSAVALDDIKIRVEISNVDDKEVKYVPQPNSAIALIAPAVDFRITAVHGGQTVNVDKFNAYVERTIAIPDGVDPNKITTGIVVQPDGTIVHVPTKVVEQSGRYFAVINSLTNSVYSVIYNEKTFDDIRTHWAKAAIEDMASRLVIAGKSEAKFAPEADITRAEFTAIMVRALGLRIADGERVFSDVKSGEWYASAVQIAVSYGLIEGYEDGTFRPNDSITREQAMAIIARAMKLANMDMTLSADQQAESIASFEDRGSISGWAKQSAALNVYHGIFRGNDNRLEPQDNISRAETAAIVRKLLQQAGLIND